MGVGIGGALARQSVVLVMRTLNYCANVTDGAGASRPTRRVSRPFDCCGGRDGRGLSAPTPCAFFHLHAQRNLRSAHDNSFHRLCMGAQSAPSPRARARNLRLSLCRRLSGPTTQRIGVRYDIAILVLHVQTDPQRIRRPACHRGPCRLLVHDRRSARCIDIATCRLRFGRTLRRLGHRLRQRRIARPGLNASRFRGGSSTGSHQPPVVQPSHVVPPYPSRNEDTAVRSLAACSVND